MSFRNLANIDGALLARSPKINRRWRECVMWRGWARTSSRSGVNVDRNWFVSYRRRCANQQNGTVSFKQNSDETGSLFEITSMLEFFFFSMSVFYSQTPTDGLTSPGISQKRVKRPFWFSFSFFRLVFIFNPQAAAGIFGLKVSSVCCCFPPAVAQSFEKQETHTCSCINLLGLSTWSSPILPLLSPSLSEPPSVTLSLSPSVVRKLQEFELPYVSISSLQSSEFHILLRKR